MLRSKRTRMEQKIREDFDRKTVLARGSDGHQAQHTENVFTNLYVTHKTEIHSIH